MHNSASRHAQQVLTVAQGRGQLAGPASDSSVARSWLRCLQQHHLDPAQNMPPAVIEHARMLERREQLQQVLDRFVSGEPGRPIKLIHMGDIPADVSVRQAIMRRQLLMQATPSCPAAMAISQLALKLEETVISRNK